MKLICNYCKGEIGPSVKIGTDTDGSPLHRTAFECAESMKERLAAADVRIGDLRKAIEEAVGLLQVESRTACYRRLMKALGIDEPKEPWTQEQKEALAKVCDEFKPK